MRLQDVRFGSLADSESDQRRGRFTPKSGHGSEASARQLRAKSELLRCSKERRCSIASFPREASVEF